MPTITPSTLTGSTADAAVDATTLLFRRMADRGNGKGGGADGVVSDAEAKTFVTEVENLGLFHIKTSKNNSLDTHEQIGALEFEMRRLEGLGQTQTSTYQNLSAQVAALVQGLAQYDTATVEAAYKAKAGTTALPAGKLVGQYENMFFVSKNAATAAEAQGFVKKFIAEASRTRTGRYQFELMAKQDGGKPVVMTLDDSPSKSESECFSHETLTLCYKDHSISDPYTIGIHEMSHSTGFYWQGDLEPAKQFVALYAVDTDKNGISDKNELEIVIKNKRLQKYDPLIHWQDGLKKGATFKNFDTFKDHRTGDMYMSYSEHVATFFEQSFRHDRGLAASRVMYDPPEPDKPKPNPNLRGTPGPDEF